MGSPSPHGIDAPGDPKLRRARFRTGPPGVGDLSKALVKRTLEVHQISIQQSPAIGRRFFIWLFYPFIYLAKWIVTRENPKNKNRGMDFYHDVVDWVGGYPYEYADRAEITYFLMELGFDLIGFHPPTAPTGCMEFVFRKSFVPAGPKV